jgi:hypothetical protein
MVPRLAAFAARAARSAAARWASSSGEVDRERSDPFVDGVFSVASRSPRCTYRDVLRRPAAVEAFGVGGGALRPVRRREARVRVSRMVHWRRLAMNQRSQRGTVGLLAFVPIYVKKDNTH